MYLAMCSCSLSCVPVLEVVLWLASYKQSWQLDETLNSWNVAIVAYKGLSGWERDGLCHWQWTQELCAQQLGDAEIATMAMSRDGAACHPTALLMSLIFQDCDLLLASCL